MFYMTVGKYNPEFMKRLTLTEKWPSNSKITRQFLIISYEKSQSCPTTVEAFVVFFLIFFFKLPANCYRVLTSFFLGLVKIKFSLWLKLNFKEWIKDQKYLVILTVGIEIWINFVSKWYTASQLGRPISVSRNRLVLSLKSCF